MRELREQGREKEIEQRRAGSDHSRRLNAAVLAVLSAVFAFAILYRPSGGDYATICGFKNLTGLPCPGCGLTHSLCALVKGEITQSLSYHLLGPLVLLGAIAAWLRSAFVLLKWNQPVIAFDAGIARLSLVRNAIIMFGVYGVARIVWLVSHHPDVIHNAPIIRLISLL